MRLRSRWPVVEDTDKLLNYTRRPLVRQWPSATIDQLVRSLTRRSNSMSRKKIYDRDNVWDENRELGKQRTNNGKWKKINSCIKYILYCCSSHDVPHFLFSRVFPHFYLLEGGGYAIKSICLSFYLSVCSLHAKSYAWIYMKFITEVALGSFSRWFHFGGDLGWPSRLFRGLSRPERSFRHKIDCNAEMVRDTVGVTIEH